ncbi:hypothetical protein LRAMOSA00059 [Lichtheimia ramosa]|uniref:Mitochondrial outer membrane protein porin n=1 Tax=Lichtheimia ramosa TaxID=688394 RepID=A0A077W895_9FUNG|nr:hypothetical protein LRAMOSA00059 [Lichtheimia ramosa]
MAVPVAFNDIGKSAKDLLTKDYPVGGVKLEIKTTTSDGVTFKVNGQRDLRSGLVLGDIEAKYADKATGIAITKAWTTANHVNSKIELDNNLAKGLKVELLTSLLPSIKDKAFKVNATYKQPHCHTVATMDVLKSHLHIASVTGQNGFALGGEMAINTRDGKVQRYSSAFGYNTREYSVAIHATNNLQSYVASYYHRINPELEASGKAMWDAQGSNVVVLEVGCKYQLDKSAFIKGRISNAGMLGIAYHQAVRPGIKLNMGASVDTTRLNENAHKLGIAIIMGN